MKKSAEFLDILYVVSLQAQIIIRRNIFRLTVVETKLVSIDSKFTSTWKLTFVATYIRNICTRCI
jgi:hypothetical protein